MLADIEVNSTVYVQPTSRGAVYRPYRVRINRDQVACACEQHTVAHRRTTGSYAALCCGSACAFVFLVDMGCRESSKTQLDESRDHRACERRTAVMCQYVSDFLLELLQTHGLASKPCDQVAHRFCRRAETQVAQQIEQLFEHSPPTPQPESAGRIASSLSPRLSVL
jgi:hypothetical protein